MESREIEVLTCITFLHLLLIEFGSKHIFTIISYISVLELSSAAITDKAFALTQRYLSPGLIAFTSSTPLGGYDMSCIP